MSFSYKRNHGLSKLECLIYFTLHCGLEVRPYPYRSLQCVCLSGFFCSVPPLPVHSSAEGHTEATFKLSCHELCYCPQGCRVTEAWSPLPQGAKLGRNVLGSQTGRPQGVSTEDWSTAPLWLQAHPASVVGGEDRITCHQAWR